MAVPLRGYIYGRQDNLYSESKAYERNQSSRTETKREELPTFEIRESPGDRQLGTAFGIKLEIVGLI